MASSGDLIDEIKVSSLTKREIGCHLYHIILYSVLVGGDIYWMHSMGPFIADIMVDFAVVTNKADAGYYTGVLLLVNNVALAFASLYWSAISNCVGRKPVFIVCQILLFAVTVLLAFATNYYYMLVLAFVYGATSGILVNCKVGLGERQRMPTSMLVLGFSIMTAAGCTATIIGSLFGGFFSRPVAQYPALFAPGTALHSLVPFLETFPLFFVYMGLSVFHLIALFLVLIMQETSETVLSVRSQSNDLRKKMKKRNETLVVVKDVFVDDVVTSSSSSGALEEEIGSRDGSDDYVRRPPHRNRVIVSTAVREVERPLDEVFDVTYRNVHDLNSQAYHTHRQRSISRRIDELSRRVSFSLPNQEEENETNEKPKTILSTLQSLFTSFRNSEVCSRVPIFLLLSYGLVGMGNLLIQKTLVLLFALDKSDGGLGLPNYQLGLYGWMEGIMSLFSCLVVVPFVLAKFNAVVVLRICSFCLLPIVVFFPELSYVPYDWAVWVILALMRFILANVLMIVFADVLFLTNNSVTASAKTSLQGVSNFVGFSGKSLGPYLGNTFLSVGVSTGVFPLDNHFCLILGGLIFVSIGVIACFLPRDLAEPKELVLARIKSMQDLEGQLVVDSDGIEEEEKSGREMGVKERKEVDGKMAYDSMREKEEREDNVGEDLPRVRVDS